MFVIISCNLLRTFSSCGNWYFSFDYGCVFLEHIRMVLFFSSDQSVDMEWLPSVLGNSFWNVLVKNTDLTVNTLTDHH